MPKHSHTPALPCRGCGYDLVGIDLALPCPECHLDAATARAPTPLAANGAARVAGLARAVSRLGWALVASGLPVLLEVAETMLFYSGKFGPHPIIANANTATRWAAYLFAITAALLLARHVRRLMFPRSRALAMLLVACTSLSLLANVVQLILSMFTWGLSKAPIFPFMHTFWTYAALRLLGLSFAAATLLVLLSIARDARAPRLLIALGVCLAIRVLLLLAYLTASGIITALMTGVMPSPFAAAVDPSMWTLNVVPWCESSAPLVVGVATLLLARTIRHLPPISAP